MPATDSHKVEDFDLQKLVPASPKAYKELWPNKKLECNLAGNLT